MTEDEARGWVASRYDAAANVKLERFSALLRSESERQNLIAASTIEHLWSRHIVDSAQLLDWASATGEWLDVGTGGGFPGLVIAILRSEPITLVEPRRRRADFLRLCVEEFGLGNARVIAAKVETIATEAAVISARAVAPIENLLQAAAACATTTTRWLLPRGRLVPADLEQLRQRWRGEFHVEQSLTDPGSSILVAEQVSRR